MTPTVPQIWAIVGIAQVVSMATAIIISLIIAHNVRRSERAPILMEVKRLLYVEYNDELSARMRRTIETPIPPADGVRIALEETSHLFGPEIVHLSTVTYNLEAETVKAMADSMRFKHNRPIGNPEQRWRATVKWHLDHGWEFDGKQPFDWEKELALMEDDE